MGPRETDRRTEGRSDVTQTSSQMDERSPWMNRCGAREFFSISNGEQWKKKSAVGSRILYTGSRELATREWATSPLFCYVPPTPCFRMALSTKQTILAKVNEITSRVGASEGIEIVEVELLGGGSQRTLRIFIDKPGGVTHGDCELISQRVGEILDAEDVIPGASYHLEVSSPGVERRLRQARDFERFAGQKAKVLLRSPVENQKRWEGKLIGIAGDIVSLEASPGRLIQFPLDQVERANLKFEW